MTLRYSQRPLDYTGGVTRSFDFMLNRWTGASVLLLAALMAARAQDAMTVIDVNPPAGQLVESASVSIPEDTFVAFSFYTANTNAWAESSQGVKLKFGSRVFTISENAPSISVTNPIVAASTPVGYISAIVGPVDISLFCSNAPARLQTYTQTKTDTSVIAGHIWNDDNVQVQLSQGELLQFASFGSVFESATEVGLPNGVVFSEERRFADYFLTNSFGTVTSRTNVYTDNPLASSGSLLVWGVQDENQSQTIVGYKTPASVTFGLFGRTGLPPAQCIAGPATVTIKRSYWNTNGLAMFAYRRLSASYSSSMSGQGGTNSSTNTNSGTSITLQLQRSTNLSDWETTDNYYINETSDKAFYRLKPVAQ